MRHLLLPLVLVVLAGCGGGGGGADRPAAATPTATPTPPPTPQEQVASTVREWLTSEDPAVGCERLGTRRVVDLYFGSVRECKARAAAATGATPEIAVEDVRVSGRRATAAVRGREPGSDAVLSGTAEVVRRGGAWKVDLLRADWAHSILIAGARQADDGLLTAEGAQPCFARGVRRTSLKEAVALVRITQLPGKAGSRVRGFYVNLMRSCPEVLNRYVTDQVVEGLEAKGRAARCLRRDLRTLYGVPLLDLTRAALTGDPDGRFVDFASQIAFKCEV